MTELDELELGVAEHPALHLRGFTAHFPVALGDVLLPDDWSARLMLDAPAPVERSEELRSAVRDLLRHGGYKPTGRGKPSSEYLVRAAGDGRLASINAAVDACNAVSLASGLPISVVDLERTRGPLSVRIAAPETRYVFNPSGQEIDVSGLLCLFDDEGPCANAVKDAQRTKTDETTRGTLSLLWGPRQHAAQVDRTLAWYQELVVGLGARVGELAVHAM